MTERSTRLPAWVVPSAIVILLVAAVATFFLQGQVNILIRTAGNAAGDGGVQAVRMFIGTYGGGSILAALGLAAWQAIALPLPHETIVSAASQVFGPVAGGLATWLGILLGSSILFGIARGLIGTPLSAWRTRRLGDAKPPTGMGKWVLLGLRLLPFVPQDIVTLVCGGTRMRFREFLAVTAVGTLPTVVFYTAVTDSAPGSALTAYTVVTTVIGVALLLVLAWQNRHRIPAGAITPERKKQLVKGSILVAVGAAVYLFVPGAKQWVDTAIDVLARGDVEYVRDYLLGFGVWAPVVSAVLMILQSIAAPLPAFVVTFANGLMFGWAWGALLSWSSAMAGAALCFWIARSLGRPAVEKLAGGSKAVEVSDLFFERYGDRTVLIARLLPFVSFDIISYGAGLTSMGFWRFFIATGLGQLPATLVYSYLGQNLTGGIRVLFFIFLFTIVVFVVGATVRPVFMKKLQRETGVAESA